MSALTTSWQAPVQGLTLAGLLGHGTLSDSYLTGPTLLLHGWLDNAASMTPMFAGLGGDFLALDLPGHGFSSHTARDHHAPFVDYLDAVLGVLDHLNWTEANLIGHSMGGAIAMLFAAAFPERVKHLVMIDVLGPMTGETQHFASDIKRGLLARRTVWQKQLPVYASQAAAVQARVGSFGIGADAAQAIVERGLVEVADGYTWRTDPRLTTPSPIRLAEVQVLEAIATLRTPNTIFLATPRSLFLNDAKQKLRQQSYTSTGVDHQLIELPGTHHLHWQQASAMKAVLAGRAQPAAR